MPYQNLVVVMGHLTAAPELRYLPDGKPVANFTVAVNESWKDAKGEKRERATFVRCNVFGGWAENAAKMDKGALCFVRGKLSQDNWEDKQTGQKRQSTYVSASEVYGFDRKNGDAAPPRQQQSKAGAKPEPETEDDINY